MKLLAIALVFAAGLAAQGFGLQTVRIAAGSTKAVTDSAGNVWAADNGYTGGSVAAVPGQTGLLANLRSGKFSYSIPLPPGKYVLLLKMIQPTINTPTNVNVFSVVVNGVTVASDTDLTAIHNMLIPGTATTAAEVDLQMDVAITSGPFVLQFNPVATSNTAVVSGIQVAPGS